MKLFLMALTFICSFLLAACQSSDQGSADLQEYVAQIKNRKPSPVAPLPTFKSISQFTYSANNLRDPFVPTPSARPSEVDVHHAKEPLENFPLDTLHMIGILLEQGKRWALILAPNGKTYEVTIGSYMGQNDGQVQVIARDKIVVSETVPSSDGWQNRTVELKLSTPGGEKSL